MTRNKRKNGVKDKESIKKVRKAAKKRWRERKALAAKEIVGTGAAKKSLELHAQMNNVNDGISNPENDDVMAVAPIMSKKDAPIGSNDDGVKMAEDNEVVVTAEDPPRLHGANIKEIAPCDIVKSEKCIGAGTFGSCYLATYRGLMVVVKEFKKIPGTDDKTIKEDCIYEAAVLNRLGDHPGLPLLFGISTVETPYRLITQFHGEKERSLTLHKAIPKLSLSGQQWIAIMKLITEALDRVHVMGFLHNDLKSNNVVLEKREDHYNPIIIDFGKARKKNNPKPLKVMSLEKQIKYSKKYPHIAPEIPRGLARQSVQSDVFSLGYMFSSIYDLLSKEKQGHISPFLKKAVMCSPSNRPSLNHILKYLKL